MNKNFKDIPLRSGVGIVLLNKQNKVFVAKRIDNPKNFWQMPQGGVDEGEDNLKAAFRELEEETSIKSVELIKELESLPLDSKNPEDVDTKAQDHAYDALRYGLLSRPTNVKQDFFANKNKPIIIDPIIGY